MTRINVGIDTWKLPDELLLAELREIKRLPYFKRTLKDQTPPPTFTLGKGHIKFFLPHLLFVKNRYQRLREEALRRGFDVIDFSQNFEGLDLGTDYSPTETDRSLIIQRICQRVMESKKIWWHYYGNRISKEEACKLISC